MIIYNIEISEPAENDLRDVIHYISSQLSSPMTAINMMDVIEAALLFLSEMPQKCPAVRDDRLASMGYRKLLIKNYIAFFTIDEQAKVVNVERILYARRDWLRLL
ncbi:type II toxin-antitoxin system RelE/ParE family toxin [Acetobacterium wieringae]|jgi:plasmid stabilization system protein ParE|uniref:Plasmid stabilization system protein n=1 Tax=Acetobacterium wieringae TaxID=52694 RepID=A0A1F2PG21_9FIRM|nr:MULTISPECIES: type II toxin-antitoxin system RelE/ParE family toxin [Acetobacterium]MEA4804860.1 type II toxin-antitoxin system RelE/ParE family toxin [Acetobacterium wieringae]OFV70297.1 plasmid stabilization system protein [Acetobacterium wieringae]TYC87116.1 type II toxin-antitoxin system RelE/ParE family toxin [Acetobacterium wieringae]URN86049.1 type II toxin-antitoxin system RelE/ParE family toxin [Acetobacterium wieringae]UYO64572.1 type II toxin-antitoxin system RelE/ParE family tox